MAKRNVHKFRQDRALTIDLLAEILIKKRILKDANPLTRASSLCRSNTRQDNRWGYNVRNLDFGDIESKHNIRPKGVKNLRLYLSIKLDGICYYDKECFDPLNELTYDIIITGSLSKDKDVICCWHLDRHISKEGDNEPEEIHPRYHFQFGGEEILGLIDELNIDFGSALFMEPPRLPHPPLDLTLGIDFVLSNFYGRKWKDLTRDTTYRKLVKEAQDRFWKPYAMAVSSRWSNLINSDWLPRDIWPQFMS